MSDTPAAVPPVDQLQTFDPLQFDQAEYAESPPAASCKLCGQSMRDVYYQLNGQAFCVLCRAKVRETLEGGSALGRFGRATWYGSLAGLVGAAIYYAVREISGINFGLIAILVGLMIGKAVRKGCNARGGWFYQALAMFLTYTAIVLTYIPPLMEAVRRNPPGIAPVAAQGQLAQPNGVAAPRAAPAQAPHAATHDALRFLIMAVVLTGFAFAIPVLLGFQSPMGLIIVGIGLYEAWVINKRVPMVVSGPFRIGPATEGSVIDVEPAP